MKIGCDIVEIARVQQALERGKGFPNFLTENEQAIFLQLKGKRRAEWLAGRFAAKEAIIKAMHGVEELTLLDVEVLQDSQGAPVCSLQGIEVSIAHERSYAIAYAIKQ